MTFEEYLKKQKTPIQQAVKKIFLIWQKTVEKKTPQLLGLTRLLIECNQGGKHIRGCLVNLGYDLLGGRKIGEVHKIAAAYEILHTSLLLHDDIIDKSTLRRGKETVFHKLGGHYGISQAICLGDMGFFIAEQIVSETKFSTDARVRVLSQFSQIILDTLLGEMLDVEDAYRGQRDKKNIFMIYELKTAVYTIVGPLVLGALLTGKLTNTKRKNLIRFGTYIGIAFQIQDDILGVFGNEKTLGKSITSDICEGKNTLLIAHALEKATAKQKKILSLLYGKGRLTKKAHQEVKQIFQATGSLDYCERQVKLYSDKAQACIISLTKDKSMQTMLAEFVKFIESREH